MDNPEIITVLSLCAGYGGLELGMALALENPMRLIAVEVEAFALANLAAKAEEGKLAVEAMWPDLRTFPAERFRGCFDFITAGYPCQGESVAGKRLGKADPRWLWPDIAGIVQAVEPVWCFFENVPGHLGLGFPGVYRSLRNMGYKVEAELFTATECGAPHRRERLFILAKSKQRCRRWNDGTSQRCRCTIQIARPNQLADTEHTGAGQRIIEKAQAGVGGVGLAIGHWPARPGQPQYEWEEPRVVADTSRLRCNARGTTESLPRVRKNGITQPMADSNIGRRRRKQRHSKGISPVRNEKEQTQPRLGGAVDGTRNRVDRLRLLGNGVVPQQAAKAFRYLYEKVTDDRV